MKLALQFQNDAYVVEAQDLPQWLALLDKALPSRRSGYGSDATFLLAPLSFSMDVISKTPEVGTDPA